MLVILLNKVQMYYIFKASKCNGSKPHSGHLNSAPWCTPQTSVVHFQKRRTKKQVEPDTSFCAELQSLHSHCVVHGKSWLCVAKLSYCYVHKAKGMCHRRPVWAHKFVAGLCVFTLPLFQHRCTLPWSHTPLFFTTTLICCNIHFGISR